MHQTRIYSEVVAERPKPVAYFLVDAMRFEMGVELAERLPKTAEVSVRHAIGALPSITPIGMAALQPGASASFSVVEQGGKLGRAHRRRVSSRPRGSEEVRGGARAEAGRRRARRAAEPSAVEARQEDRRRPGRRRALAGDRPRRRDGLHVPGPAGHGHRHRQPGARDPQAGRRRASSTRSCPPTTATCSSLPIATSRCASMPRAGTRSISTAAAGSVAAAPRLLAAFASRRRPLDTNQTSILCFRAVAECSRRAVTSPSTTAGRRFRS